MRRGRTHTVFLRLIRVLNRPNRARGTETTRDGPMRDDLDDPRRTETIRDQPGRSDVALQRIGLDEPMREVVEMGRDGSRWADERVFLLLFKAKMKRRNGLSSHTEIQLHAFFDLRGRSFARRARAS